MDAAEKKIPFLPTIKIREHSRQNSGVGLIETRLQAEAVILEMNAGARDGSLQRHAVDEKIEQHLQNRRAQPVGAA